MMLDPHAQLLAYLPLDPAPPLPLPTIQLNDGSKAAVAGSLACLTAARDPQRAAAVVGEEAGGPGTARPGARPLEALRLLEVDVRSFAKGEPRVEVWDEAGRLVGRRGGSVGLCSNSKTWVSRMEQTVTHGVRDSR